MEVEPVIAFATLLTPQERNRGEEGSTTKKRLLHLHRRMEWDMWFPFRGVQGFLAGGRMPLPLETQKGTNYPKRKTKAKRKVAAGLKKNNKADVLKYQRKCVVDSTTSDPRHETIDEATKTLDLE